MPLRERAEDVRDELVALGFALGDPRTPPHAKVVAGLTLGLAASPVDPIPDFVPVLGYVDDAVVVPVGLYLAKRSIPEPVLADARAAEGRDPLTASRRLLGLLVVVLLWTVVGGVVGWAVVHALGLVG
jgi:uncharacterized membrane protein YkvA (DUF1232 family)